MKRSIGPLEKVGIKSRKRKNSHIFKSLMTPSRSSMMIPTERKVKYEIPKNPSRDCVPFLIAGFHLNKDHGKEGQKTNEVEKSTCHPAFYDSACRKAQSRFPRLDKYQGHKLDWSSPPVQHQNDKDGLTNLSYQKTFLKKRPIKIGKS